VVSDETDALIKDFVGGKFVGPCGKQLDIGVEFLGGLK